MHWLGLDWDEGPFHQSERLPSYAAAAEKLLATGAAYLCYCAPEKYAGGDAAEQGEEAKTERRRITRCACRDAKPASSEQSPAVRFRVPLGEVTRFDDAVFGPREVANEEIEDFVLLRSAREDAPGVARPTYQLAAVVDDIEMRITHVISGADHISNTPKQALLYRALGATPPIFAHVPLILGPDRTRLSKRHGATSVGSYQRGRVFARGVSQFPGAAGLVAGR